LSIPRPGESDLIPIPLSPSKPGYVCDGLETRARDELYINIQPIQAAGHLTADAMKAMISYGDGYSVCDFCLKPFRLDKIKKPSLEEFHVDLAKFVGMDVARTVPGARRGFQAVVSSLVGKGDSVILQAVGHYTEFLAIEQVGGIAHEAAFNDRGIVTGEAVAQAIENAKKKDGKLPKLVIFDHYDYTLANEHDILGAVKAAKEYDIPVLYNGAYTVGVKPVDGKALGVDYVVGSGHKSMASPAPSGVLATTNEAAEKVFRTTKISGDVSGRKFGVKEVEMLGCTLMGANIVAMMASLPHLKERVKCWDAEVKNSNYFVKEFLRVDGNKIVSECPRKHCLTKVDCTESYDKIAQKHKDHGYFFTHELDSRGITGIFPGSSRSFKMSTYGLTDSQVRYLAESFLDIAKKHGLEVH